MRKRMKAKANDEVRRNRQRLVRQFKNEIANENRHVPSASAGGVFNQFHRRKRRILEGRHPILDKPLPLDENGREFLPDWREDRRDLRRPTYRPAESV